MTRRQRESIAKYLYDLSKITFAAAVLRSLVDWQHLDMLILVVGAASAAGLLAWGFMLDGMEEVRDE